MICEEEPFKKSKEDGWIVGVFQRASQRPNATVLMLHGFTGSHVESGRMFVSIARYLCQGGISVVRFDFRGHGDSSGEFEDFDLDQAETDVDLAREASIEQGVADPKRIGLLGLSMGGYVALRRARDAAAVALISPAIKIPEQGVKGEVRGDYAYMGGQRMKLRLARKIWEMDALPLAPSFSLPLLVVHAKDDEGLFQYSEKFVQGASSRDKTLIVLEKGGHLLNDYEIRRGVAHELLLWFRKRLQPNQEEQSTGMESKAQGQVPP